MFVAWGTEAHKLLLNSQLCRIFRGFALHFERDWEWRLYSSKIRELRAGVREKCAAKTNSSMYVCGINAGLLAGESQNIKTRLDKAHTFLKIVTLTFWEINGFGTMWFSILFFWRCDKWFLQGCLLLPFCTEELVKEFSLSLQLLCAKAATADLWFSLHYVPYCPPFPSKCTKK